MGYIEEPEEVSELPPSVPPPPVILPQVTGVIEQAIAQLRDGKSGFVVVHEHSQDGQIHQTHGVFVKRLGENFTVTLWGGREWNKPGTIGFGASMAWEFD